jgi:signal transduction histidine kinase
VIARFSDFAKVPAPVFVPTPINDSVRSALRLFQAQLEAPGRPPIKVVEDLDATLGTIPLDAEQFGRALQNLVLNGIDAMPHGGTLTVRTRRAGNLVRIDVADTGEGLMPEERDRLFTPYYTTKQHGTGLGLAIVQSVVSDHGGRIRVQSQRGRGTTFHIELPAEGRGEPAS